MFIVKEELIIKARNCTKSNNNQPTNIIKMIAEKLVAIYIKILNINKMRGQQKLI